MREDTNPWKLQAMNETSLFSNLTTGKWAKAVISHYFINRGFRPKADNQLDKPYHARSMSWAQRPVTGE